MENGSLRGWKKTKSLGRDGGTPHGNVGNVPLDNSRYNKYYVRDRKESPSKEAL